MNRIVASFEKVSFEQFKTDFRNITQISADMVSDEKLKEKYDSIELPTRSTKGSAGYDFKSYFHVAVPPSKTVVIPTGIRVHIREGWFLAIVPRSSYGFKYRTQLDNTIGVIDEDYFYSDNEGHIIIKMTNDSKPNSKYPIESKTLTIKPGDKFAQGIFMQYGITADDNAEGIRNGGFGSTDGEK